MDNCSCYHLIIFATLFNVEFTHIYLIFLFQSFLNLFLHNVLIVCNQCVFKILSTCLLVGAMHSVSTHTSVSFWSRG